MENGKERTPRVRMRSPVRRLLVCSRRDDFVESCGGHGGHGGDGKKQKNLR